ncbi:flagellar hook capping FlgD N-terminal domain-containing protein [Tranquillimonas rosea]|uniref:flagellar hook capping FlgD N-terminal domain-containing protein n=1 Tax=Tranquillimonas rosea TaxID=641238 RepID=UPI003BAA8E85
MDVSQTVHDGYTGRMPSVQTKDAAVSSDFETFLKMLTTQLENQDPLEPVKSEDFAVQLATFSGVEQQVKTNDLLASVAGQIGAMALSQMSGWVGKEARAAMPVAFDGTPVTLVPEATAIGDRHVLVVRDASGATVGRMPVSADGAPVEWAGTDATGAPLPEGQYGFAIETYLGGELVDEAPVETFGRILETRMEGDSIDLVFAGGVTVPADAVTALRDG